MRPGIRALILLGAALTASASAQDVKPAPEGPRLEITELPRSEEPGFVTLRVNGSIATLQKARAKDIIESLYPAVPIVGAELLPRDRRFAINAVMIFKGEDILAKLGETLGLSITQSEATTDFLIVRNLTHPVPPLWTPTRYAGPDGNAAVTGMKGIGEVDKVDHLFNAYDVGMIDFVNFLTDHTDRPVWNQTSLTGAYSFSFRLPHKNVMKLLNDMGFDVFNARRTTRCIVIAAKPETK